MARGVFGEVHYPIEPRNPPPLRLVITARGEVKEDVAGGFIKAVVIGALLFIPVGIIRFSKDFTLDADVSLLDAGRQIQRFRIEGATQIAHTMFSDIAGYETEARRATAEYLAAEIAARLRQGTGSK
ncbi:MAG: hypothetical protein HY699_15805 [Deltaproteobacteria bacterium]|nr:hypothetical protein [Deltaproteobacteria bacterium]